MLLLAEVFGQSGDALTLTMVGGIIAAVWAGSKWMHKIELRLALIEQRQREGLDTKKSGVYPVLEDK
jgi:uncharacterized BrkB/YihY/UPF0761 family membrane protein